MATTFDVSPYYSSQEYRILEFFNSPVSPRNWRLKAPSPGGATERRISSTPPGLRPDNSRVLGLAPQAQHERPYRD